MTSALSASALGGAGLAFGAGPAAAASDGSARASDATIAPLTGDASGAGVASTPARAPDAPGLLEERLQRERAAAGEAEGAGVVAERGGRDLAEALEQGDGLRRARGGGDRARARGGRVGVELLRRPRARRAPRR